MRKLIALFVAALASSPAFSMGTAFTFQGSLEDGGAPAQGDYDLQFRLMNPNSQQFGPTLLLDNVPVVSGVFTVQLDFGTGVLSGIERVLQVGVRPGISTGSFTVLTPNTPLHPAPYAQVARLAETAELATNVASNSVFTSDLVDGSVTSAKIADEAVTVTKIADGAVRNAQIASNAISLAKMADASVDTDELVNSAVTNAKVASGSILPSRLAGDFATYALSFSSPGNTCIDADITPGGDVQANDIPLLTMASNASLPNNLSVTALRVNANNVVEVRVCNHGSNAVSFSNLSFRLITFR